MTRLTVVLVAMLVLAPVGAAMPALAVAGGGSAASADAVSTADSLQGQASGVAGGAPSTDSLQDPSSSVVDGASSAGDRTDLVTVTIEVRTPDGDPIGNADVVVTYEEGRNETRTFSNGNALVDVPRGADLTINVTHPDYELNFPVGLPSAGEETITITMRRASLVIVNVEDENGAVGNADVTLYRTETGRNVVEGTTGADGRYRAPEVEQGEYLVEVSKDGYYTATQTVEAVGRIETTVELEEGSVPVSVTVRDDHFSSPQPVSDATVRVLYRGDQIVQAQTGDNGGREVSLGVNAQYTLQVTKDGYTTDEQTILVGEERREVEFTIQREASVSVQALNSRVVAGETVLVRVRNAYGEPVEGARILRNGTEVGRTDASGELQVTVPEEDTYEITAEANGASDSALVEGIEPSEQTTTTTETTTTTTETTTTETTTTTTAPLPGFTPVAAGIAVLVILVLARRRGRP